MKVMAGDGTDKLFTDDGLRLDGRRMDQLRETKIRVGIVPNARGSAEIRNGSNIIVASVYGPREMHPRHKEKADRAEVQCTYRMATFSVPGRKAPHPSRREREISKVMSEALNSIVLVKKFPRMSIDVNILILQADGGTRTAALTCAATALVDAGIPMRGIIASTAAGLVNDKVVLDLSNVEDQKGSGDLPVAYCSDTNEVSLLQLDGQFTQEQFEESLDMAINGAKDLNKIQKEALLAAYSHKIEGMDSERNDREDEEKLDTPVQEGDTKEQTLQNEDDSGNPEDGNKDLEKEWLENNS